MGGAEHLADGGRVGFPGFGFGAKVLTAGGGELVVLGLAVVVGEAPLGFDEAFAFQAPEGGVERAFFHEEGLVGLAADEAGDGVAVEGAPGEGFEDDDVERAAQEVERMFVQECAPLRFLGEVWHGFPLEYKGRGGDGWDERAGGEWGG